MTLLVSFVLVWLLGIAAGIVAAGPARCGGRWRHNEQHHDHTSGPA